MSIPRTGAGAGRVAVTALPRSCGRDIIGSGIMRIMDLRQSAQVKLFDTLRPQLYHAISDCARFAYQPCNINPQTYAFETLQVSNTAVDVVHGAPVVAKAQLIEADADLEYALVKA